MTHANIEVFMISNLFQLKLCPELAIVEFGIFEKRVPTTQEFIQEACDKLGFTIEQLRNRTRRREIVYPRAIAMWWVRINTTESLASIGRLFGGLKHDSCLYLIRKVANVERRNDAELFDMKQIFQAP